ncbi:efflux RND transporter periplasmic adaptor subunit [Mesorhizobium sp. CAU 1732]|uniref:efflux RND transporter periplasmic adaptor subunit n=1 Tax=Mesorhizobium sp. CAU 1732 TaxID=3140358 RepID=UPI0032606D61
MARKWTTKLALGALLIGGIYAGVSYLGVGPAALDANARTEIDSSAANRAAPRPLELAEVEVNRVKPTSMEETLRVSGELRPVNRVVLRAKVGGTVNEVNARAGQAVKAGDVLIRFETEDLQSAVVQRDSNLDAARAQLVLSEQTLDKTEELSRRGFATRAALEKAQSDVAAARANVQALGAETETARTALRDAEIIAPFDGVVASRSVEPGAPATANADLLTIVDTSVLEAEVLVSTRDITRLRVGQVATLQIDGLDGQSVTGTVDRINPVVNEGSRFVAVHIRLENTDGRLWGGMFATGSIQVRESKDVFVLPSTSLREDEAGAYVFKLADGKLLRQPVSVGARWNGGNSIEIADGIDTGDTIVVAPLPELEPDTAAVVSEAG